jgi:hypothetical protein
MNRLHLNASLIFCLCASTANADDYTLRFNMIESFEKTATGGDYDQTPLHSIEVIARPGSTFFGKVKMGNQTLTVNGELHAIGDGSFKAQVHYVCLVDTGIIVATKNNLRESLPDTFALKTIVNVTEEEPVTLGSSDTISKAAGKPAIESKKRCVLVLTRYQPTCD